MSTSMRRSGDSYCYNKLDFRTSWGKFRSFVNTLKFQGTRWVFTLGGDILQKITEHDFKETKSLDAKTDFIYLNEMNFDRYALDYKIIGNESVIIY